MDRTEGLFADAKRFEDQEMFERALEKYEEVITLNLGNQALAHQGKGRALARLRRLEEAITECKKALKIDEELYIAHGVLGSVYYIQEEYSLAEGELLNALRLNSEDIISMVNLIGVYSALGDYSKAIQWSEELLKSQPKNLDIRVHLVRLYITQTRFRDAIVHLNIIFTMKPAIIAIYPLYLNTFVGLALKWFSHLNILMQMGIVALLYLIAILLPTSVSVLIGAVLTLLFFFVIVVRLRSRKDDSQSRLLMIVALLASVLICSVYWLLVFMHQLNLILQNNMR